MRSPHERGWDEAPHKVEFETFEEFEEAKAQIESLLLENFRTMKRAEHLTDQLESKRVDLQEWQNSLDKEQDRFAMEKEEFAIASRQVLDLQTRIEAACERVNVGNQDSIEVINEALLLLELEEDPKVIAQHLRAKREELDVKW